MTAEHFLKPNVFERLINKGVGLAARLGLGPSYMRVVQVRGRKTGKIYSTPVNILELDGRLYLVGGRGHTAWSRNAAAAGELTLVRGRTVQCYRVVAVGSDDKARILRAYLIRYRRTVQRFFSVPASSPVDAFHAIEDRHPAFELIAR